MDEVLEASIGLSGACRRGWLHTQLHAAQVYKGAWGSVRGSWVQII